jgi:3-deoxy-manno-octulosonate cytidylyltransferase (CMP-KDO synthetase)
MKVFAFIPARYGSTRFPGKPLALICGKPMIRHVYERAISCPVISGVFVATDDDRISDCIHEFGGKAVMTRKAHRSGTDRIFEAAQKMGLESEDLVINIQGDQPLFHPSHISKLVGPLKEGRSIGVTTLKRKITDEGDIQNPNHVKVVTDLKGCAIYFSRYPIPYFRDSKLIQTHYKHLGFYGFRMEALARFTALPEGRLESAENLEQLRLLEHGVKIRVIETTFDSIEVDVPEDIAKVEKILQGMYP